ncbi:hypothetical protein [Roseivirga sp.]|uniref:hypothetical protein n=1 Tax=Roseivirga sp. TaxID=1964215 RepID=UPI003B51CFFB
MATYTEQEDKLHYQMVDNNHPVIINLTPIQGTLITINYGWPTKYVNQDKREEEVGNYAELKGNRIRFTSSLQNPDGSDNQFEITISQQGNNSTQEYKFPDEYTGTPDYEASSDNQSVIFYINF